MHPGYLRVSTVFAGAHHAPRNFHFRTAVKVSAHTCGWTATRVGHRALEVFGDGVFGSAPLIRHLEEHRRSTAGSVHSDFRSGELYVFKPSQNGGFLAIWSGFALRKKHTHRIVSSHRVGRMATLCDKESVWNDSNRFHTRVQRFLRTYNTKHTSRREVACVW